MITDMTRVNITLNTDNVPALFY